MNSSSPGTTPDQPVRGREQDGSRSQPHVFLDCDGVLADFDAHGLAYFGKPPREAEAELGSTEFWRQLEARGDFYRSLPLMADARTLYDGVKHLNPTILTGCPRGNWAEAQKVAWAAENFPGVPIITCRSANKRDHAKPGDVLIDDWPQHRHRWLEMGGHFISHYDAATSLAALWAIYPEAARAGTRVAAQVERESSRERYMTLSQQLTEAKAVLKEQGSEMDSSVDEIGGGASGATEGQSPAGWVDFNVNNYFRIRLTEAGLRALKKRHDRIYSGFADAPPFFPPKADADGWVKMQAWCVMQDLGPSIFMGGPTPFETTIQVSVAPLGGEQRCSPGEASAGNAGLDAK